MILTIFTTTSRRVQGSTSSLQECAEYIFKIAVWFRFGFWKTRNEFGSEWVLVLFGSEKRGSVSTLILRLFLDYYSLLM